MVVGVHSDLAVVGQLLALGHQWAEDQAMGASASPRVVEVGLLGLELVPALFLGLEVVELSSGILVLVVAELVGTRVEEEGIGPA